MNYYIDAVHKIRVPNVEAVEELHEELKTNTNFELISFGYKHKDVKVKGEIVDSYELVTATLKFNEEKEPYSTINISYNKGVDF